MMATPRPQKACQSPNSIRRGAWLHSLALSPPTPVTRLPTHQTRGMAWSNVSVSGKGSRQDGSRSERLGKPRTEAFEKGNETRATAAALALMQLRPGLSPHTFHPQPGRPQPWLSREPSPQGETGVQSWRQRARRQNVPSRRRISGCLQRWGRPPLHEQANSVTEPRMDGMGSHSPCWPNTWNAGSGNTAFGAAYREKPAGRERGRD